MSKRSDPRRIPNVFFPRPNHYRRLETTDELNDWEATMRDRVGLELDRSALEELRRAGLDCTVRWPQFHSIEARAVRVAKDLSSVRPSVSRAQPLVVGGPAHRTVVPPA